MTGTDDPNMFLDTREGRLETMDANDSRVGNPTAKTGALMVARHQGMYSMYVPLVKTKHDFNYNSPLNCSLS